MSEIIRARALLQQALDECTLEPRARRLVVKALALMHREAPVRVAPKKYRKIDAHMRRRIRQLDMTDMTMQEIAVAVGLRSSGRVSEVLHGKR